MQKNLLQSFPLKHLEPRECFITREPTLISTVLGSCVAVTVYHPATRIGGMSHAFLPSQADYPKEQDAGCKFVDTSIEHLLNQMALMGAPLQQLEVKLFGGGEVTGVHSGLATEPRPFSYSVGARNVEVARRVLIEHGINLRTQDVGGHRGRKLLFLTLTGGAWVKRLGKG